MRTSKQHSRGLLQKKLKLNQDKLTIAAQEVEYFGHVTSSEGLKPDPKKVKAIQNMPPPTNKKELQTMLGMITYLAKFAPLLSDITKPMIRLAESRH